MGGTDVPFVGEIARQLWGMKRGLGWSTAKVNFCRTGVAVGGSSWSSYTTTNSYSLGFFFSLSPLSFLFLYSFLFLLSSHGLR